MKKDLEMAKKDYNDALEKFNSLEEIDMDILISTSCWGSSEERAALEELSEKRLKAYEDLQEKELRYFTLEAEYEYKVNGSSEAVAKCADVRDVFVKAEQAVKVARVELFTVWQEGGELLDVSIEKYAAVEKKFIEAYDDWWIAQKRYVEAWKACKSMK